MEKKNIQMMQGQIPWDPGQQVVLNPDGKGDTVSVEELEELQMKPGRLSQLLSQVILEMEQEIEEESDLEEDSMVGIPVWDTTHPQDYPKEKRWAQRKERRGEERGRTLEVTWGRGIMGRKSVDVLRWKGQYGKAWRTFVKLLPGSLSVGTEGRAVRILALDDATVDDGLWGCTQEGRENHDGLDETTQEGRGVLRDWGEETTKRGKGDQRVTGI
ncbi:hypothetical protein BDZ91DRAFT_765381 [Kalaharituber pfeilii]|nr:hypothetical protein BDZ91DRAFT_765381 [Kalaharituber pfeilii]